MTGSTGAGWGGSFVVARPGSAMAVRTLAAGWLYPLLLLGRGVGRRREFGLRRLTSITLTLMMSPHIVFREMREGPSCESNLSHHDQEQRSESDVPLSLGRICTGLNECLETFGTSAVTGGRRLS